MYSCVKYPHFRDRLCSDVGSSGRPSVSMINNDEYNYMSDKGSVQPIPVVAAHFCFKILILLERHSDGVDITGS